MATWELRWILLGMGAVLIAGVYIWSRRPSVRFFRVSLDKLKRAEPALSEIDETDPSAAREASGDTAASPPHERLGDTYKVVTLRFIGRAQTALVRGCKFQRYDDSGHELLYGATWAWRSWRLF